MRTIRVTKQELDQMIDQICDDGDFEDGPYETAFALGFPGFAGGVDHVERGQWSLKIIDRGVSGSGYERDNSTKFVVPVKNR